jgi:tol-pal system protein YbgF
MNGGNGDLALKGFTDYVQNYASTAQAPAAQYYIGEIYYQRGKYEEAARAFDAVLEKYGESERAPDAHYMKGLAFRRMGETEKARSEFRTLMKRFPNHPLSDKAESQLKALEPASKPKRAKGK